MGWSITSEVMTGPCCPSVSAQVIDDPRRDDELRGSQTGSQRAEIPRWSRPSHHREASPPGWPQRDEAGPQLPRGPSRRVLDAGFLEQAPHVVEHVLRTALSLCAVREDKAVVTPFDARCSERLLLTRPVRLDHFRRLLRHRMRAPAFPGLGVAARVVSRRRRCVANPCCRRPVARPSPWTPAGQHPLGPRSCARRAPARTPMRLPGHRKARHRVQGAASHHQTEGESVWRSAARGRRRAAGASGRS